MTNLNRKLSGCYRRTLIFLFAILAVSLLAGGIIYRQIGGPEGARYWMAERALNGVQQHLISKNRPDGISEDQVTAAFATVRTATQERRVNLTALYRVLRAYQDAFHNTKPATPEVQTLLQELRNTVISGE